MWLLVNAFYGSYAFYEAGDVLVVVAAERKKIQRFVVSEKVLSRIQRLLIQKIGKSGYISRIL